MVMEGLNEAAELRLRVVQEGLSQVIRDVGLLNEATGHADQGFNKLEKSVVRLEKEMNGTGKGAQAAERGVQQLGKSTTTASQAAEKAAQGSLPRLRYALYDVATTYGIVSAAALASSALVLKTAADFESSFTNVERTMEPGSASVSEFREQLVDLSTQIPKTFDELSKIATLGNQLGVPASEIEHFTEVIAQFSTITGMTADASAQAFGRLSNILGLPISKVEQLASSIALAGRRSASTESEIIGLAQRLGSTATRAGFTTDEVIGLASALGSLGVAPERAQGVFETYFNSLNESLAEGGEKLEAFSAITGLTVDSLNEMVRTGQGFEVFKDFLGGLQGADTVQLTDALDLLGLSGLRANEVVGRISGNLPLLKQAFNDAAQGFSEGSELSRQYAIYLDDLNTQLQLLWQSVLALMDAGAGDLIPGLADAVGVLVQMVDAAREFVKTPVGGALANILIALTIAIGLWFAYAGATALATASTAALITAQKEIAANKISGGIWGLTKAMLGLNSANVTTAASTAAVGGASATASGGVALLGRAFQFLAKATVVIAVIGLIIGLVTDLRGTTLGAIDALEWIYDVFAKWVSPLRLIFGLLGGFNAAMGNTQSVAQTLGRGLAWVARLFNSIATPIRNAVQGFFQWGKGVIGAVQGTARGAAGPLRALVDMVLKAAQAVGSVLGPLGEGIRNVVEGAGKGFSEFDDLMDKGFGGLRDWGKTLPSMWDDFDSLTDAVDGAGDAFDTGADTGSDFADSLNDVGDGAGAAAAEVRTLVDYASDLESVFSRSFEIRFGSMQAQDAIASSWNAIAKEIEETNAQIKEYQATMASLTADKAVTEFWLTVAEGYGDTLRAGSLRADLAKIESDLAKTGGEIAAAQEKNNQGLTGNSDAAIANRAELLNLVGQYQDYITSLASSGASQDELIAASQRAKQEFINQAIQMGYSRAEVDVFAVAFDDLTTVIENVPRNITVTGDANPAIQALNEFVAHTNASMAAARAAVGNGIEIPIWSTANVSGIIAALEAEIALREGKRDAARAERLFAAADEQQQGIYALQSKLSQVRGYRSGGYTGNGGENELAGFVHGKEYVVDAPATRALGGPRVLDGIVAAAHAGRPFGVEQMAFAQAPIMSSKPGKSASAATGPHAVELSPYDRELLQRIEAAVGIHIDGDALGAAASAGYVGTSRRGDG